MASDQPMTERSAEERFVEAMRDLLWDSHAVCTGEHPHNVHGCESDVYDAVHAFADAVCELSVNKIGFGGDVSDCGLRASKTLNQAILDAYPNSIPLRSYSEEKAKEHATCRANLLKRVMGGE